MIGREIEQEMGGGEGGERGEEEGSEGREEKGDGEHSIRRGGTAKLLMVDNRPTIKSYNSNSNT